MRKVSLLILILAILAMVFATLALAQTTRQVTLAWDANDPAPDGYRLYMRTADNYETHIWQGTATTATVEVSADAEVAFVVRAAKHGSISGEVYESANSNEVMVGPEVAEPKNLILQALDKIAEGIDMLRTALK